MENLLDFRLREQLTAIGGYELAVSEFIRINNTLLPKHSYFRRIPELLNQSRTNSGTPVKVQLLGGDPICMAENAALLAELHPFGIDLNFGCPAPIVNRNKGGAILLKEPKLMEQIVSSVRNSVPKEIPVSAKMRLGYDSPLGAIECAEALESGGASEIVVHARTKTDGYKPPAYWEWIRKLQERIKIPIVANGEIWTTEDAKRCLEISGCQALMLGRGAVANPWLALEILGIGKKEDFNEVKNLLQRYWYSLPKDTPGEARSGRIKLWLRYLCLSYAEANQLFEIVKSFTKDKEWESIFPNTNI